MVNVAFSINNVPIRLTDERWTHIVENHDDLAGYYFNVLETVTDPDWVFEGGKDEFWAAKLISGKKALLVIYKEIAKQKDGFILTAFFTTKIKKLMGRKTLWQR
jgi:hypothetical protein